MTRPEIVEPRRELVAVEDVAARPIVDEPRREVTEVVRDGGGTLVVAEPVPTYTGSAHIDTTGAQVGQVLTVDVNGVLRPVTPAPRRDPATFWVEIAAVPAAALPGDVVVLTDGSGEIYEVREG